MALTIGSALAAETMPESLIPLREAVFEHKLDEDGFYRLYNSAKAGIQGRYSGIQMDLALSRREYLMGKALQDLGLNKQAISHYDEGMKLAEKAVKEKPGAEAWLLRAENLSQLCSLRSVAYAMANGLDVEKFAKNSLNFDSRNANAQYLIAARWVYAPAPFSNHTKGIEMMKDILENGDMDKDNYFNVYSSIGYGYVQQKKYSDARPWLLKALEIYPTNKYANELLDKK